jgi:uncharacterized protein YciI
MLWAIYCVDRPNSTDLRMKLRPEHLEYLKEKDSMIVLAGATLTDDGVTMTGSVIIIDAPDRATAEAFSEGDPFRKGGLFESVVIKRMRKGIWNPAHMPEA